jgi:hypothetical protein
MHCISTYFFPCLLVRVVYIYMHTYCLCIYIVFFLFNKLNLVKLLLLKLYGLSKKEKRKKRKRKSVLVPFLWVYCFCSCEWAVFIPIIDQCSVDRSLVNFSDQLPWICLRCIYDVSYFGQCRVFSSSKCSLWYCRYCMNVFQKKKSLDLFVTQGACFVCQNYLPPN